MDTELKSALQAIMELPSFDPQSTDNLKYNTVIPFLQVSTFFSRGIWILMWLLLRCYEEITP